jgi:hypothetical protein
MIIGMHHVTNAVVATGHKCEWFQPSGEVAALCATGLRTDHTNR